MGFLGMDWKDGLVMGLSAIPGVGAPLAGAAAGITEWAETGSLEEGLKTGLLTGATAAIPGGKIIGTILGKAPKIGLGEISKKLLGTGAGQSFANKVASKSYLNSGRYNLGNVMTRGGGKGLGNSAGRAIGRAAGGGFANAAWSSDGSGPQRPDKIPTKILEPTSAGSGGGGAETAPA
ncbi:hypothetical protein [Nocardia mexicana]|uniref:Uncharacterized protein n=1 Tax=Nocardia mexicana TaxID=279262 RepID=A0A370HC97_9NOCA|nr:hypothetical protein [Nocardia mexicana]RDI54558.1 hypothetical protein DFR68_102686 [Nocardia mexicana]